MPTIRVHDINMYYETNGAGPPLLLIMGMGSDLTAWMYQVAEFSKKYRVIAFDNRGVGRTDAPDKPYSIEMMADDTIGLMDALGIEAAHVLGASMGGYIAEELAIKYPRRVKSLLLVSTAVAPGPFCSSVVDGWTSAFSDGISWKTYVQLGLPYLFTSRFFDDREMVRTVTEMAAGNPYPTSIHGFARQAAACSEHNARGRVNKITAPTLVLVGREDVILPVKLSEELASLIPKAKLVVLEGGGHGFALEIPDKFNQAVLDFLAQTA